MSNRISVTAREKGVGRSQIVREQLEKAKGDEKRSFMRLAGAVDGPADLSKRKGFSRK
jgi:hypothetical protein